MFSSILCLSVNLGLTNKTHIVVFQRTLPPTVEAEEEVDLIIVQVVSNLLK